jgi:pyrroloquinoline quinone (PQQ) biosynthesis protein C
MNVPMAALQERLLGILDRKHHWAWPRFAEGKVPLPRLLPHFQQEWEVYVRDFPILLSRVLGHGPPARVRGMLAANIYEEQTGGISQSAPHPELFLQMMEGCRFSRAQFDPVSLLPASAAYREHLDRTSRDEPWVVGAAVLTLFVEGSANERRELAALSGPAATPAEIEASLHKHPLVRFHGVDPAALALVRVHKLVEGGHRSDAWEAVLDYVRPDQVELLVAEVQRSLDLWLAYRDGVAAACGIER